MSIPKIVFAKQDLLSSVVVFLVALPLCMGIAIASGVPPAAGLITGIVGGILVGLLSGCPLQVSGPAAGLAVIVYEIVQKHGFEMLGPIVLIAGLFQLAASALRAGHLFRAISPAVIYGMLAGIGVLIFAAQFHVMVDDKPRENGIKNLLSIPESIYKGLLPVDGSSHHLAAYIGVGTIVLLLLWTKFAPKKLKAIPGALVGVAITTVIANVASMPIRFVEVPDNFLGALKFSAGDSLLAAITTPAIVLTALTVAVVASAETLLSAAAVDQMHDGPKTQYNRELMAQGVGNTISGFLGALPMTGVIVRSATNVAAGARTRMSAVLHGVWLLVLVAAFPGLLRLVPTAALAAVLVYTGYKLVNPANIRKLLQYGGAPVVIYFATVVTIVAVDLLTGIATGVVLSALKIMWARTRLKIHSEPHGDRVDLHLEGAATFVRLPKLQDALERIPEDKEVRVHLHGLDYIDDGCVEALTTWEQKRREKGQRVVLEWDELMRLYRDRNPLTASREAPEPERVA